MKKTNALCGILSSVLLLSQTVLVSHADAQQLAANASAPFVLQDGTPVKLRLAQTVSSADAHVNDRVEFEVLEDVSVNNVVLIPKGSSALGTVTEAVPKRRMARGGKLEIVLDSVRMVDGEKIALRAVKDAKGGGHTGAMTIGIVAGALVFLPAAPLFLLMHGKDITIPKGTDVPSTINVPPGKHSISVRKIGFQDWTREMNFSGGTITLSASLVAGSSAPVPASTNPSVVDMTAPTEMSVADAARLNKKARDNQPQQH